jgi:hypothetical protein
VSAEYNPSFCLDCGFDYTWCPTCENCACGCICWDEALWQRAREANFAGYERYRLWRDEGAQGVGTQAIDTVELEGDFL